MSEPIPTLTSIAAVGVATIAVALYDRYREKRITMAKAGPVLTKCEGCGEERLCRHIRVLIIFRVSITWRWLCEQCQPER